MNFSDISRQIDMLIGLVENEIYNRFESRMNTIIAMYDSLVSDYAADGELDNLNNYNRLNKMITQLKQDLTTDFSAIAKTTQYAQMMAFIHSTVGSAFLLSTLTGVTPVIAFPLLTKLRIRLSQDIEENELTNVLAGHRNDMLKDVSVALRSSANSNISPSDTRRRLKRIQEKYTYRVQRVSTYEIGRAESLAAVENEEKFKKKDLSLKRIWVSQRDQRVRDTHVTLDGQTPKKDGLFHSPPTKTKGVAPRLMEGLGAMQENMGCRCSVGYRINGIELDYLETDNMSPEHQEIYEKTSFDAYQDYIERNRDNIHPAYYAQLSKGMAWDAAKAKRGKELFDEVKHDLTGDSKKFMKMLENGYHKKKDGSWGY